MAFAVNSFLVTPLLFAEVETGHSLIIIATEGPSGIVPFQEHSWTGRESFSLTRLHSATWAQDTGRRQPLC